MKFTITIRAEMSFAHEVEADSAEAAREIAVQEIRQGSEGNVYERAYELFEHSGFDAWTVDDRVEDEKGRMIQIKPWYSWE